MTPLAACVPGAACGLHSSPLCFVLRSSWVTSWPPLTSPLPGISPEVGKLQPQLKSGLFPLARQVKNPPAMQDTQEMWVQSLGREDPPEEEMATHSSILAWEIPWTEEPGRLQSVGSQRVGHN